MKSIYDNLAIKREDEMVNTSTSSFDIKIKYKMDYFFISSSMFIFFNKHCYSLYYIKIS